ncbi:MAG TPA: hypothetical protein VMT89_05415, partial [Candidatus Acidoferrales bacterium]|nr:hypothetical protein [Candidatus Acidoferrales bacterium]
CGTDPKRSFACIGYGPSDIKGGGGFSEGLLVSQQTAMRLQYADGVYSELPMKGIIKWNSHAFNLTGSTGKLEAWVNFEFALPDEQRTPERSIFDISHLFSMNVPAFSTQEICSIHTLPPNAHLHELTSHTHKRGKRFRIFDGAWHCQGGRNNFAPCSPFGPDFNSPDLCAGAPCVSVARVPFGDCDRDGAVTISEIVTGVNVVLGVTPLESCQDDDGNGDGEVSVDELLVSINAALGSPPDPTPRDPQNSLRYVNLIYNDPVQLFFDPPRVYPMDGSSADERALTYCSLYDNGFTNPNDVKRKSTSPPATIQSVGGPCAVPTGCTAGQVGAACSGDGQTARNASCDSSPGAGDGICDACPLQGGETTEDEMCILIGSYYVP